MTDAIVPPLISYPELSGRVAMVTGVAHGIGFAIAAELATQGMQVFGVDMDEAALRKATAGLSAAGSVALQPTDVGDEAQVRNAVGDAVTRFGQLDALINNAAIADPFTGPVESLELREWELRLRTNLTGAFLCTKHAVPHLRAAEGAIVNMASTRACQSEPDAEAYAASKGGLVALTHALAVSLGPSVRVNAVSPGWIDTPGEAESLRRIDHAQHPVGRVGRPTDVASLVAWLVSDAAAFVTGQEWRIDGGMTRRMQYAD